jgi:hypothetical protein
LTPHCSIAALAFFLRVACGYSYIDIAQREALLGNDFKALDKQKLIYFLVLCFI